MHLPSLPGSCVLDDDYWQSTVTRLLATVAELKAVGIDVSVMNIGGGPSSHCI